MGLFSWIGDIYDYHINYYRMYLYRRYLFDQYPKFSLRPSAIVWELDDSKNTFEVVSSSTKLGAVCGVFAGIMVYHLDYMVRKHPYKQALLRGLGWFGASAMIGFVYGTTVVISSNMRGGKNDEFNHGIAAATAFPIMGRLSKQNKGTNGFYFALWGCLGAIILKYAGLGKFKYTDEDKSSNLDFSKAGNTPSSYFSPIHYKSVLFGSNENK